MQKSIFYLDAVESRKRILSPFERSNFLTDNLDENINKDVSDRNKSTNPTGERSIRAKRLRQPNLTPKAVFKLQSELYKKYSIDNNINLCFYDLYIKLGTYFQGNKKLHLFTHRLSFMTSEQLHRQILHYCNDNNALQSFIELGAKEKRKKD